MIMMTMIMAATAIASADGMIWDTKTSGSIIFLCHSQLKQRR
jgi:hypothetical protein